MTRGIISGTVIALFTTILITGTIPIVNADAQNDFENCPPPEGIFVKVVTNSGEVKFFEGTSYSTAKTGDGTEPPRGTGSITKDPGEHSSQLNELVGMPVQEIVIVDCHLGKPSYRYTTTLTGVTITSMDQSGSSGSPPTETIGFDFENRAVNYEKVKPKDR